MKKTLSPVRIALRAVCLLLVFALLFSAVSRILRNKTGAAAVAAFYAEPEDSLDVLLLGSSHMLNAVNPLGLWEEYGIVSNNLAQSGQVLPVTCYALADALEHQSPRVVVVDVYKVIQDSLIDTPASLHFTLDNMPLGRSKVEAVFDLLPAGERAEYLVDLIAYHSRWKELTSQDLASPDLTEKGAETLYTVEPHGDFQPLSPSVTAPPARTAVDYLERIVSLCARREIPLLLVAVPFTVPADDDLNRQAMVNGVEAYAHQWGVPFVNLLQHTEEMGFSFEEDMADVYHVNWRGMDKVTSWLGEYLRDRYDLPDRRGQSSWDAWDAAAADYRARRAARLEELGLL